LKKISPNFFSTVLPSLDTVYMDFDEDDNIGSCINTYVEQNSAAVKLLPGSVSNTCIIN
jgi:hypothetical protein